MSAPDLARWQRLKELFALLSAAPADEREARAASLCEGDRELLAELLGLLASHDQAARDDWWPLGAAAHHASEARETASRFAGTDRFELLERLGAGGHGVVFRARDRETGGLVALKVLRHTEGDDLLRFKREFRTLVDRHHPGLVRVHELFVGGRHTFFTMELVDGVPLTEGWDGGEADAFGALSDAFAQLARTLDALHATGFVHRDLKPSNVLRTTTGRVVVLDFGLVTDAPASQDQTGRDWGTPRFMAPEVRAGAPASAASDWFAVGLMLDDSLRELAGAATSPERERLETLSLALRDPEPTRRPSGAEVVARLGAGTSDGAASEGPGATPLPLASAPPRGEPCFVGRVCELATLEEAWADVGPGRPAVVFIEGPSGVGKTALARHFLERVRAKDSRALVLSGRCHVRETLGFRAFDGVLDSLNVWMRREREDEVRDCLPRDIHELAALFPVLGAVPVIAGVRRRVFAEEDAIKRRQRAFSALRELLGRLAFQRPLLLFIDDFQWADGDSLALLAHVLRGPEAPSCLVLATRRADPLRRDVVDERALLRPEPRSISLSPLSSEEAQAMAVAALGGDVSSAREIAAGSGGMPFLVTLFVDELARAQENGAASESGEHDARTQGQFAERLVRAALGRLPPEARVVLEALAVASRPLPRELVARLAEVESAALYQAEDLLRSRHLTRPGTGAGGKALLEPYHDRVRDAVVAGLSEEARLRWHRRLAEALAGASPFDAAEVAHHWREAGERAHAAAWALTAAREASLALAFDRAVHLYEVATASTDGDGLDTGLLREWAEALDRAGRCREAAATYLRAAERDTTRRLSLKARAGDALLRAGDTGKGRALLGDAITAYGWRVPRSPAGQAAAAIWFKVRAAVAATTLRRRGFPRELPRKTKHLLQASWALASSLALVDTLGAAYFQARHQHLALAAGAPAHIARALGLGAIFAAIHGARRTRRVTRYLQAFDQLAVHLPDPGIAAMRPVFRGVIAWLAGDWRACHAHAVEADELLAARRLAVSWEQGTNRAFLLASLVWLGRLDEHRRLLPLFLDDARTRGDIHTETSLLLLAHQHLLCLADDAPERVEALLASLDRWSSGGTYPFQFLWRTYAEVETALYQGQPARAVALWAAEWPRVRASLHMRLQTMRIFFHHLGGRVALAAAELSTGAAQAKHLRRARRAVAQLMAERVGWAEALGLCLRAGLERLGSPSAPRASLAAAERALRASDMILHADVLRDVAGACGEALPPLPSTPPAAGLASATSHVRNPRRLADVLLPAVFSPGETSGSSATVSPPPAQ